MIVPLILALLLPISPACAAEGPANEAPPAIESADFDLLGLEKDLAGKLEQKNNATLKLEDYQEWEKEFRTRLAAGVERVSPSPDNQAAYARIKAMLGDRKEAGAALDQALEGDPDNPVLLRTKGQFLLDQKDYDGAAKHGLRAYEISGRSDQDALALYHAAKGRTGPTGANSVTPTGDSTPAADTPTAAQVDSRTPYKLSVKGSARMGEVPSLVADDASGAPAQDNGNGFGFLTKLGVAVGVLLIAWGAVPAQTKEKLRHDLWEQPKQEMKTIAIVGAVAGAVYLGVTYIPPLLATVAPAAPSTMVPALAGGGMAGGGVALQQAAVGTAKAGLLAGGSTLVLNKASDYVSYAKSNGDHEGSSSDGLAEPTKHGTERFSDLNPSRGGILSTQEAQQLKATGRALNQKTGGKVYLKEITPGRYDVYVENLAGKPITSFKNIRFNKLQNLARNYGWEGL